MRPGDVVAQRFEIERIAGSGGMGVVLRAKDRSNGATVALKVLHGRSPDLASRLEREAKVLADLDHPAIVRYVAHGRTREGEAYLALEWLEGEDLSARLARGRLSVDESVALTMRVAQALGFAHARGVVHRDVKPSNVFLVGGAASDARVLDFGVARVIGATAALTLSGVTVGTPAYMAPEQARGESDVDGRADVFALGCVLFECLTGKPAFSGAHAVAVLAKILFEEPPQLADACPEVPAALAEIVQRMLAKDRAGRPRDGADAARAIGDVVATDTEPEAPRTSRAGASIGRAEQRIVSVVVARRDARAFASAPTMAHGDETLAEETAYAIADRFGARLEVLLDGSAVGVLDGERAATDQAAIAARFARAIANALPDAAVALATGRAVVSGRVPFGEAIDRAAAASRVGSADRAPRLDEITAGLLDARFDVRERGGALLLVGEREIVEGPRALLGRATTCVGRAREIDRIAAIFDACVEDPSARIVRIIGAAGVGKSRLRHEVVARLCAGARPPEVWIAEGDPARSALPYGAIAGAIRRASGALEGDPDDARRARLRARIARSIDGDDAARVAEFLAAMIGLPDDDSARLRAARRDPILMGDQVRRAFVDLVDATTREGPLVIVMEALESCDPPSAKLVGAALGALSERPILVIALARPEVDDMFPKLWEHRAVEDVRLAGLPKSAAESLVKEVLGDAISAEMRARIVTRAAGNAFFLEELLRAAARGDGDALPATVLAMTEGRIAALDPDLRRVLRAASVMGEVFFRGGVEALLGGARRHDDVRAAIADLVDREILVRRGEGRIAGDEELCFRHALLCEAAYGMLTDTDRAIGHALAGRWFEEKGERDAALLAAHFSRGGDRARAATYFVRAARDSLSANDFDGAIAHADRGRAEVASGEVAGELALVRGEALHWSGRTVEADAWAREALALLDHGSARWWSAAALWATILGQRGSTAELSEHAIAIAAIEAHASDDEARQLHVIALARAAVGLLFAGRYEPAAPVLARAEAIAARVSRPDAQMRARVEQARGVAAVYAGDLEGAARTHRAAVAACDEAGDRRMACAQRSNLGDILRQLGLHAEAERALRDCRDLAASLGLFGVLASTQQNLGVVLAARGALAEAADLERASIELCRAHDLPRMEGIARAYLASVLALMGSLDAAEENAAAAAIALVVAPPLRAHALAIASEVALARGLVDDAIERAREANAILDELGGIEEGEVRVRTALAAALDAHGDRPGAQIAIDAARRHVIAGAQKIGDPVVRASFLASADNARAVALSRAWIDEAT